MQTLINETIDILAMPTAGNDYMPSRMQLSSGKVADAA